jgi:hypothetical protein
VGEPHATLLVLPRHADHAVEVAVPVEVGEVDGLPEAVAGFGNSRDAAVSCV